MESGEIMEKVDGEGIRDQLVKGAAVPENAFRLFDKWFYDFPGGPAGSLDIASKRHILAKMQESLGSFDGLDVLELGPHEGQVTYALEQLNPHSVLSIEGRSLNFLKCLTVKNHLGLKANFMLGDFERFLADSTRRFDVIIAMGILYHMVDPLRLIELICQRCEGVAVDTITYDKAKLAQSVQLGGAEWRLMENEETQASRSGFTCTYYRYEYDAPRIETEYGAGGLLDSPNMMTATDILHSFEHFGMRVLWSEQVDQPNGPHLQFTARWS